MADGYDASWLQHLEPLHPAQEDDGCPPPLPDQAYAGEVESNVMQFPALGQGDAAHARASKWFCAADLEGLQVPDREWLVPDLIPARTVTLLYGDGGTGKSLLALQLAVAVALGQSWIGLPVKSGKALFPSAEDEADELHRRLADIVRNEGARLSDLRNLTIRSLAGEDAMLARLAGATGPLVASDLYREVDALLEAERPALLVLDTLADMFPGNENDKAQVRAFVGLLKRLAIKHDCAVVVLAHPSLSGMASGNGTSGNVAWSGSARSRLYLERVASEGHEADQNARILRTMKANYGPKGGEIVMRWKAGVFVADATPDSLDRMAAGAKAERVFMRLLSDFTAQGRHVSASPSSSYAPTVFAAHPNAEGMTKRAFAVAMNALFEAGKVVIAEHGKGAKARKHIAVSGGQNHGQ